MSYPIHEGIPPLGEPTPFPRHRHAPRRRRRRPWLGAAIALVLGLAGGFALGQVVDGDGGGDDEATAAAGHERERGTPSTTAATVPAECVETIRSAQQALALLEQGLKDLRDFDVIALDAAGREMQRLQRSLDQRVRRCAARISG